jgi:2-phospho-L-lactate guanylyltransferase
MSNKVIALIPVKKLAAVKGRLETVLRPIERQALTLLCLYWVLKAISHSQLITKAIVIGSDSIVNRVARECGANWLDDPGWTLNESLEQGFAHIAQSDAAAALFLPCDLPFVTPLELDRFVGIDKDFSNIVLAPSHDGGTNAILLPNHLRFQPNMGPGSLALHLEQVQRMGLTPILQHTPGLTFDVDTPEDFQNLSHKMPTIQEELSRWRLFLDTPSAPLPTLITSLAGEQTNPE